MPEARLFKHRQLEKFHKLTERRLQRRDVEMAESCGEMEFSMEEGGGEERMDNVTTFLYLGGLIDQMYDDWTDVLQNIMRASSVWGRLGESSNWKWKNPWCWAIFHKAVVHKILLYGLETWVLLAATERKVEGIYTEFLL